MTRILITTFGTRGDIQPFIALSRGLKTAGYEVAVCTSEGFQSFVEEHDLSYRHMDNELLQLSQAALRETAGIGGTVGMVKKMAAAVRQSMDDEWKAAREFQPDVIIYHPKCLGSFHVAEKLQIPAVISGSLYVGPAHGRVVQSFLVPLNGFVVRHVWRDDQRFPGENARSSPRQAFP